MQISICESVTERSARQELRVLLHAAGLRSRMQCRKESSQDVVNNHSHHALTSTLSRHVSNAKTLLKDGYTQKQTATSVPTYMGGLPLSAASSRRWTITSAYRLRPPKMNIQENHRYNCSYSFHHQTDNQQASCCIQSPQKAKVLGGTRS